MEDLKKLKDNRAAWVIIGVFVVLTAVFGSLYYYKAKKLDVAVQNQYREAVYELSASLNNIDVNLSKAQLTTDPRYLALISSEIGKESAYAKANLGRLPVYHIALDNTQKFLSQVSDYTNMLSVKAVQGGMVSSDELKTLEKLAKYSASLNDSVEKMRVSLESSDMPFDKVTLVSASADTPDNAFTAIEDSFENYPTMIYDGPFSDHITNSVPLLTKDKPEISAAEAMKAAAKFVNTKNLYRGSDSDGKIPYYGFKFEDETNKFYINVTKQGGYVLSMFNGRDIKNEKLSEEDAIAKAEAFLEEKGFRNTKHSYFEKGSGKITVNFSPMENNAVIYPDLIKVSVALDNGEIVGYDATHYILNHKSERNYTPLISKAEAQKKISENLKISSSQLCIIPLKNGKEALCYEFTGKLNKREFLCYINAENGREEQILLVVTDENGTLTI